MNNLTPDRPAVRLSVPVDPATAAAITRSREAMRPALSQPAWLKEAIRDMLAKHPAL